MTTVYTLVSWLAILGYWLLIAGVTLRILMKRRAVPSAMAWLLIIYILPLVGIIAYLAVGELHLGKRRAERARAMWPSTAKWLNDLKACKHIFAEENSSVAAPLFKLCERRQGIAGVKGNQLQLMTESDDVMQALIRDIQLARHNIEMVFYIWQPGGMADQVAESLMAAARRGIHCRLMLDSAGSVAFFRSPWPELMRNAGIEVVEALKVNLMRVFLRRMDLRQHRKMIMIDNYIAYTGSMNMVDPRYFKQDAGVGQWIDLMARMEGPIATAMGPFFIGGSPMRLDKYLKVSRLIKRRTLANEVADAGRVLVNGKPAKASYAVKVGDEIEITFGNRPVKVRVLAVEEPRGKDVARELFEVIGQQS